MDSSRIGIVAAELMETISDRYGDDAEITGAMVMVEVEPSDGEPVVEWRHDCGYARLVGMAIAALVLPPEDAEDE